LRVLFATDVHGSEKCFRKFLNAGHLYKADVMILGGDITGKFIAPVIPLPDNSYKVLIQDTKSVQERIAPTEQELAEIITGLRLNGFYPYRTTEQELNDMKSDPKILDGVFEKVITAELERWLQTAEQRLKDGKIKCYVTGGNDDPLYVTSTLEKSELVQNPEGQVVDLGDSYEMLSCGFSNQTPWKAPREMSEEGLADYINGMASQIRNHEKSVFNIHVPPFDAGIDAAPKLDVSTYPPVPVMSAGQYVMVPVGSKSVRTAIEKYAPLVGLFGHIHESKGAVRIGRTMCFNPGSEYSEGVLCAYLLNFQGTKVQYQLLSG
jgi:Icc-related predicted phosphoesterase